MIRRIVLASLVLTMAACASSGYRSGYRDRGIDRTGSTATGTPCPKSGDPFEMFCQR